jgi:hypothetical protein
MKDYPHWKRQKVDGRMCCVLDCGNIKTGYYSKSRGACRMMQWRASRKPIPEYDAQMNALTEAENDLFARLKTVQAMRAELSRSQRIFTI